MTLRSVPAWPIGLMIELTTVCNLHCPLCLVGNGQLKRPNTFLDFSLYANLVSEVKNHISRFTLHGQGESFIHPHLIDIICLATKNGIKTRLSTNGHFYRMILFVRN